MKHTSSNDQSPLLSFEFATSSGEIQPLTFRNPIQLIVATKIEEILPCFEQIQEAVEKGYYAAGFLTYESAPAFDAAYKVRDGHTMPLLWFGIFSEPQQGSLNSSGTFHIDKWEPTVSIEEYNEAIKSIKQSIEKGDTFQTNYTIRLKSTFEGDDIALFQKLKRAQASNYCAYINTGEHSILSASPELFFHIEGDKIITRPMKGTTLRGKTVAEDEENAKWLYHSEKNRSENVMIVDLLRNDLGRIAELGSVHVTKLFEVEQYPTVHQMTSTVKAKIAPDASYFNIFKAIFPCGSITGAPKISTMDIISQTESTPREVYCGAIGYFAPNGEAVFNVPIRTVVIDRQTGEATYGVGGGITWDSTAKGEYHEVLAKASFLERDVPEFQLLESILLQDGEFFLLDEHLRRLSNSAKYFGFSLNIEDARAALSEIVQKHKDGEYKIRLLLDKSGTLTTEAQQLKTMKAPMTVTLADKPINKENLYLYHKTTHRKMYEDYQNKFKDYFDVLLWNENEELTEFTNGNIVLEIDGSLWTPPIECGLLSGTYREVLIKEGRVSEKTLTLADLEKCTNIWFINSVRKWLPVQLTK
ncbi:aminodeoxychorismate synthase component I [Ureibacillus acetophenoni]|uniref:Para-aminobenzoate synthetase/4-amino-4-deoxychorismate lyase n=1 Tax=Ureibacillus acetophenoni TaxID=614649 RepID=A0A285UD70_9BACL|nr:aminodeoxychorismate synthase component I [Ureibacillus acetophenoni]SOC39820.1 para-aminobenzoate synthetase/4-amino-4-deoxychorismate lyase [Ureibacillus acetophenoni]